MAKDPRPTALVTGGTSGIGRAIAFGLAGAGYRVVAAGRDEAEVASFDPGARSIEAAPLDVTDAASIRRLIDGMDRLDALVNSAGIILREREYDPDGFRRVIDVNLDGTMRMCAAAKPLLEKTRGSILNLASMLSFFGSAPAPAYSASKGGVAQLTKSLAIAWAEVGIRVNAIAPGWIETPLTAALSGDPEKSRAIVERTPMKRWGAPEEVAGAAVFLCSPAAGFITGVVLPVDGGYSIA